MYTYMCVYVCMYIYIYMYMYRYVIFIYCNLEVAGRTPPSRSATTPVIYILYNS